VPITTQHARCIYLPAVAGGGADPAVDGRRPSDVLGSGAPGRGAVGPPAELVVPFISLMIASCAWVNAPAGSAGVGVASVLAGSHIVRDEEETRWQGDGEV
jgi:hypothetical protein